MTKGKLLFESYHSDKWFEPGGWQELMLVGAAVNLDIFTTLAGAPMTAAELAITLGLNERAVEIFLQALVGADYLKNGNGAYSPTEPARAAFGDKKNPGYLGWAVLHSWRLIQRWSTLPEVLQTGKPVPGDRFIEGVEGFIRAMDVYAGVIAKKVVDHCLSRRPGARNVLDIGGATGTVSKVFADRGLNATLFDIPEAIETVREEVGDAYPSITLKGGDFNQSVPRGPFDIAFLGNVVHIYGPDKNRKLFQRVQHELAPDGLMAILDFVRGRSASAPFFGINMLVNTTAGGAWTEGEYRDWLAEAGCADLEFIDLEERDQQLILGRKSG